MCAACWSGRHCKSVGVLADWPSDGPSGAGPGDQESVLVHVEQGAFPPVGLLGGQVRLVLDVVAVVLLQAEGEALVRGGDAADLLEVGREAKKAGGGGGGGNNPCCYFLKGSN